MSMSGKTLCDDEEDDLERFFLQDVDDLEEAVALDSPVSVGRGDAVGVARSHTASPSSDPGAEGNSEWEEFMNSAKMINEKLERAQGVITDSDTVELLTIRRNSAADSIPIVVFATSDDTAVVSEFREAVAVIMEDMILSLEQLWDTKNSSEEASKAVSLFAPDDVEETECTPAIALFEEEEIVVPSIESIVDDSMKPDHVESIRSRHETEKLAMQLSLDAEQEKYARMEEIFRLKREEDQLRFEKRQARRSQVVQERRCNNAAVCLQRYFRGHMSRILVHRIRGDIAALLESEKHFLQQEFICMSAEDHLSTRLREHEIEVQNKVTKQIEQKRLEAEEARIRLAKEEGRKRLADEVERKRQAAEEEERKRQAAEEVERKRQAAEEVERKRQAAEEEKRKRQAAEEVERKRQAAEEVERKRQAAEEEKRKRQAAEEVERKRQAAEEEKRKRLAEQVRREQSAEVEGSKNYYGAVRTAEHTKASGRTVLVTGGTMKRNTWGGVLPRQGSVDTPESDSVVSTIVKLTGQVDTAHGQDVNSDDIKIVVDVPNCTNSTEKPFCTSTTLNENTASNAYKDDSRSVLYNARLCWRQWLQRQPELLSTFISNQAEQQRFIDRLQNLYRSNAVTTSPSSIGEYTVEDLEDLSFLTSKSELRHLILNVNRIRTLRELSCLSQLNSLCVKDNRLKDLEGVADMRNLLSLVVDVNKLEDLSAAQAATSLVLLSASTNNITDMPHLDSPFLQRLNLYHNKIDVVTSLSTIRSRVLTHLDLGRNKLSFVSGEAISQCQLLTQLILSQNCLEVVPFPLRLPNLRSLWISGNKLVSLVEWAPCLESSEYPCFLPLLENLYLQDNSIRSVCQHSLSSMPLLSHLDLSFNGIGDALNHECVMHDLVAITDCRLLRSLQLQENPVNNHRAVLASFLLEYCPGLSDISGERASAIHKATARGHPQHGYTLNNLLDGGEILRQHSKTQSGSETVPVILYTIPFSGALSNLQGRFSQLIDQQRSFNYTGLDFTDLVHSISAATVAEKHSSKNEDKQAKRKIAPQEIVKFDPLRDNGVDTVAWIVLLLQNIFSIYSWETSLREPSMYCTLNSQGETGYIAGNGLLGTDRKSSASSLFLDKAVIIQKNFRGYLIRRQIAIALATVRYQDDELDEMLIAEDLLDGVSIPELDDGYWKVTAAMQGLKDERGSNEINKTLNRSAPIQQTLPPVAYGDHVKSRRSSAHNSDRQSESIEGNWDRNNSGDRENVRNGWSEAVLNNNHSDHVEVSHDIADVSQFSPRPVTNMSDMSVASSQAHSIDDYEYVNDATSEKSTPRRPGTQYKAIAAEWGFTDPQVIAAMKKRNNRMKGFASAKEKREKSKSADERLKSFKQAARIADQSSGAFGGKPKQFKRPRPHATPHPAWLGGTSIGDTSNSDEKN